MSSSANNIERSWSNWAALWALLIAVFVPRLLPAATNPYAANAVSRHLKEVRERAGAGFDVQWEHPFAIVGDVGQPTLRLIATNTVRWAVVKLKAQFFTNDPLERVDIWLFKDDASYRRHAKRLFGHTPETPFGYYSPSSRALVMNISTGTGTLVHEMVHAFMPANFTRCPAWFNEGLASLYEQSGERNGRIVGFPNWRLPGLQRSIRDGTLPSFEKLLTTTTDEFYGRGTAMRYNSQYAQARYLCYTLQEQNLLERFFREFRRNAERDPGGYATLKEVLGEKDMEQFQKRWEIQILLLKGP